ncbi:MAG: ABC transporter permease [Clostridium sp.]|uniref:ABC transporter permease n=1 Tax=Clostridium sp. TaxID=1506 RepID=UPI0039E7F772
MNTQILNSRSAVNKKKLIKKQTKVKYNFKNIKRFTIGALLPIFIMVIWEIVASLNILPVAILPTIQSVFEAFLAQIENGQLLTDVSISLIRVMEGYFFAVIIGIFFGVIMGVSFKANNIFSLLFTTIRQVPTMAWIPLIILWCGIGETSKIVIIAKAAFFPILLNTISGIKNTPKGYLEVAQLNNVSKLDLYRKVYFPAALPSIFTGLRLGLGIAWGMVVAAEIIASSSGIGYRINDSRSLMQSDIMISDMIVIGVIGAFMDFVLRRISKHFSKWQASEV